jgi:streptogramin lyase
LNQDYDQSGMHQHHFPAAGVAITSFAILIGSAGFLDAMSQGAGLPPSRAIGELTPAATVALPGEPCAGLATGFGSLWIPLCAAPPSLAKVDLAANRMSAVFAVGPAAAEGGITIGAGSVWLIVDKSGTLARIDPATGAVRQTVSVPAGSYNPHFDDLAIGYDSIWLTDYHAGNISRYSLKDVLARCHSRH